MKQLDKLNFDKDTLVAFYLGGKIEGVNIEAHDVQFFIGKSLDDFTAQVKKSWIGIPKSLHIDSWLPLTHINGYDIKLSKTQDQNSSKKLFFINLGFYQNNKFGEAHSMHFIVAETQNEAKSFAKSYIKKEVETLHTDNIYDIDDCIHLENIGDFFIHLTESADEKVYDVENGWMRLA